MKNTDISGDTRIGDIATALPASMRIFEQYGVDFCCGGDKPLAEALQGTGLSLENVRAEIEEATTAEPQGSAAHRDLAHATPEKLIEHILDTHHRYLKRELPGLENHLETVISVHGDGHPELHELGRLFSGLKGEIEGHLDREEKETFPAVRNISEGDGSAMAAILGQMEALEREHDTVGDALKNMRGGLTSGYRLPADACPTYTAVYKGLGQLEADVHRHVHLENNVLFPALRRETNA